MAFRLQSSQSPIGIDLAGRHINAAQTGPGRQRPVLAASTSIDRGPGDEPLERRDIDRLAGVLERHGFEGRDIVLAVPSDDLLTALLELPPATTGVPIAAIARNELAAAHKCDPSTIESSYWEVPTTSPRKEGMCAMAVGCRHEAARSLLDTFEHAGFRVVGLDAKACALYRACSPLIMTGGGLAVIVAVEWAAATIVAVSQGVVVYERTMNQSGLSCVHRVLCEELGLDSDVADHVLREVGMGGRIDTEDGANASFVTAAREPLVTFTGDLVREMRMATGYATQEYGGGGGGLSRLLVLGEGACVPGLATALGEQFGHESRVVTPADAVECRRASTPLLTAALGLALYPEEAAA